MKSQSLKSVSVSATIVLLLSLLLSACITTQTGGFNVDSSDEEAMEDFIQLALGYYNADDMAGARRHIANALAINDRNSDAYTIRALVFQREGDLELAQENFAKAIRFDGTNSRARNNYAALLFSTGSYQEAYEQLEVVSNDTSYEGRSVAFENLGRSALKLNKTSEAANAFSRALNLNSNLYLSSLELAQLRFDQGELVPARNSYRQYLSTIDFYNIPHTPRSLWLGIQIEQQFGKSEELSNFTLLLSNLYQESPEYQLFLRSRNENSASN